jgi:hypothetical protein
MAEIKISALPVETDPKPADVLPMVSDAAGETRKVAIGALTAAGFRFVDGGQGTTEGNETIERTFHSFLVPGNTMGDGDLWRTHYLYEVLAFSGGGNITTRIRANGALVASFALAPFPNSVQGFDFLQLAVIDTGAGPSAFRILDVFNAIDVVVDTSVDVTWTFTAQFSVASVNNTYRALIGHMSRQ